MYILYYILYIVYILKPQMYKIGQNGNKYTTKIIGLFEI